MSPPRPPRIPPINVPGPGINEPTAAPKNPPSIPPIAMNAALPTGSPKTNISRSNPIRSPRNGILPTVLLNNFLVDLTRGVPPIDSNIPLNPFAILKRICSTGDIVELNFLIISRAASISPFLGRVTTPAFKFFATCLGFLPILFKIFVISTLPLGEAKSSKSVIGISAFTFFTGGFPKRSPNISSPGLLVLRGSMVFSS